MLLVRDVSLPLLLRQYAHNLYQHISQQVYTFYKFARPTKVYKLWFLNTKNDEIQSKQTNKMNQLLSFWCWKLFCGCFFVFIDFEEKNKSRWMICVQIAVRRQTRLFRDLSRTPAVIWNVACVYFMRNRDVSPAEKNQKTVSFYFYFV